MTDTNTWYNKDGIWQHADDVNEKPLQVTMHLRLASELADLVIAKMNELEADGEMASYHYNLLESAYENIIKVLNQR